MERVLKERNWQLSFLLAWAAAVIAAAAVLGAAAITGAAAIAGIVLAGINALVAPAGGSQHEQPVVRRLRALLNVGPYLKLATIGLLLFALAITFLGAFRAWRTANAVTLAGAVVTPQGDPAAGSRVTIRIRTGSKVALATSGEFRFPPIPRSDFPSGNVTLVVTWRNQQERFSQRVVTNEHLHLRLVARDFPLRLVFRNLPFSEISSIVAGQVSEELAEILEGQPYILPTGPYHTAKRLLSPQPPAAGNESGDQHDLRSYTGQQLGALFESEPWRLAVSASGDLTAWRFSESYPIGNGATDRVPRDLSDIVFWTALSCDAEVSPAPFYLSGHSREITMSVLTIENTLPHSVRLGKFFVASVREPLVRRRGENERMRHGRTPSSVELFPLQILRSGEKILLPLELSLSYSGAPIVDDPGRHAQLRGGLQGNDADLFTLQLDDLPVPVRLSTARAMLDRNASIVLDYVAGSSLLLRALEVDGVLYPTRQPSTEQYVLFGGDWLPATSCPFLFTRHGPESDWESEGHILFGFQGKGREATDTHRLRRFDGTVLIREEEQEVTWIDQVQVRALAVDGTAEYLEARHPQLRTTDGAYLRLAPGESIQVGFNLMSAPLSGYKHFDLQVTGFYIPIAHLPSWQRGKR